MVHRCHRTCLRESERSKSTRRFLPPCLASSVLLVSNKKSQMEDFPPSTSPVHRLIEQAESSPLRPRLTLRLPVRKRSGGVPRRMSQFTLFKGTKHLITVRFAALLPPHLPPKILPPRHLHHGRHPCALPPQQLARHRPSMPPHPLLLAT